jgi:cytochrome c peroxidase
MGLAELYETTSPAQGQYAVNGKDADRLKFKVPTLHNVKLGVPVLT